MIADPVGSPAAPICVGIMLWRVEAFFVACAEGMGWKNQGWPASPFPRLCYKSVKYPWYKPRGYRHFDKPVSESSADILLSYMSNPVNIIRHGFLPFISYEMKSPRYKKTEKKVEPKIRPIAYASHRDSLIYSYYSHIFCGLYENYIKSADIEKVPIAYRQIKKRSAKLEGRENGEGGKCNIDFAFEAFSEIRRRGNCVAICFDVSKFFDSLDHKYLSKQIGRLFPSGRMPDDYFSVVKSICKFSCVKREDIIAKFPEKLEDRVERRPYCKPQEFRNVLRASGLIKKNRDVFGIPQGSPISGVLSNIYMIEFDSIINQYAIKCNAYYRRYCDDIIIICDNDSKAFFISLVRAAIHLAHLRINEEKTEVGVFVRGQGGEIACTERGHIQYLGFDFDGSSIRLRSSSLSRYWAKMLRLVRARKIGLRKLKIQHSHVKLDRRSIYNVCSHLGKRTFFSYAKHACEVMGTDMMKRQLRRHWKILNNLCVS